MAHEIQSNPNRIRFTEVEETPLGTTVRRAILRESILQEGTLAWVQEQKVQYLDSDDARALRDFLSEWLDDR
jgi:hypothetical protein